MALANAQWNLTYDTSKLQLNTAASKLTPYLSCTTNSAGGTVYGNFTDVDSPISYTTSKTFLEAEFTVLGTGSTDVTLTIEELSVGDGNSYKNLVEDGTVKNISGNTGYENASLSGTISVTQGGASSADYGDVNLDGKVTTTDVTILQKGLAGFSELSDTQRANADANRDGNVDIKDATYIQRYVAGYITTI